MSEITLNDVVSQLQIFNERQDEIIQMDELRDDREFEVEKATEKRNTTIKTRIEISNTLLDKLNKGFGRFFGMIKSKDLQQAEDRRELLETLKSGVKVEKSSESTSGSSNDAIDSGPGFLSKMNQWIIGLVGGSAIGRTILSSLAKVKKFITSIDKFLIKALRVIRIPSKYLQGGKILGPLGRLTGFVTIVYAAFKAIKGAIDGYEAGGIMGALRGGIIGGVNALAGWLFDIGKWFGKLILKFGGADADTLKAIDSFSFKDLITKLYDTVSSYLTGMIENDMTSLNLLLEGEFMEFIEYRMQLFKDAIGSIFDKLSSIKEFLFGRDADIDYDTTKLSPAQRSAYAKAFNDARESGLSDKDARTAAIEAANALKQTSQRKAKNRPTTATAISNSEMDYRQSAAYNENRQPNIAVGGNTTTNTSNSSTVIMQPHIPMDNMLIAGMF